MEELLQINSYTVQVTNKSNRKNNQNKSLLLDNNIIINKDLSIFDNNK